MSSVNSYIKQLTTSSFCIKTPKMSNRKITTEVQEIAIKLQNILQISQQLQEMFSSNYDHTNEIATEDIKSLMTIPTAMKEYGELIKHLYNEWQHVMDNGVDLGNILSYDGSVFKPQMIPYVHVVHCVISDIEMVN